MSLYSHALNPEQLAKVGEIYQKIGSDRYLYQRAVPQLEDFIERFDRTSDLSYGMRNRLFKNGAMPKDSSLGALLYDFLVQIIRGSLNKSHGDKQKKLEILSHISSLSNEINDRINHIDNPFVVMARDVDPDDIDRNVPQVFMNRFIGYRRSSHGEVVRFYLKIFTNKHREKAIVRYQNFYWRGKHKWQISGAGMYAKNNILYLFGHARDERNESTGYRIMALKQLGTTSMLCGPLISMDEFEPIAARAVLIPWDRHDFTEHQLSLSRPKLLEHIIRSKKKQLHSDEYEDYIDEIRHNVSRCFPNRKEQGLYHYISNLTTDVIHCIPDDEDDLIFQDLRYRLLSQNSRYDIRDDVIKALQTHADNKNRM